MSLEFNNFRQPWILQPQHISYNNATIFVSLLAAFINAFLLVNFFRRRRDINRGYYILINMCVADFISSCCVSVSAILHAFSPELPWEWCQSVGMILTTAASTSGLCAAFLSMERYSLIVLSNPLSPKFLLNGIIFVWIICIIFCCLPFFTQSYYRGRPSEIWCLPIISASETKHLPFSILSHIFVWAALIAIPWCYWRIYKFAISYGFKWGLQKGAVTAALGASTETKTYTKTVVDTSALRSQLKLTKKFALLIMIFYIGWFGLAISFTYEIIYQTTFSPLLDFVFAISQISAWFLNAFIVLTMDNRLKVRLRKVKSVSLDNFHLK
ncbi:hypothetical protein BKA69DRAFT_713492 [Paraphysoderma sedebokerense]|nr:hypothetical protein BKA69DRAFT_713492 [Paraphysoderma sedebokerense]